MILFRLQEIASEKETTTPDSTAQVQPEMGMVLMMRTIGEEDISKDEIRVNIMSAS